MGKLTADTIQQIRDHIDLCIPQVSINCVIFRFHEEELSTLAVRLVLGDLWMVPGGYILQSEGMDEAVHRIVQQQTLINDALINQFGTFGNQERNFAKELIINFDAPEQITDILEWASKRFITTAYYSIVQDAEMSIQATPFFDDYRWLKMNELGTLAMDHANLVQTARKTLSKDLLSKPVLLHFLPDSFTIPTLQKLYEAILDRPIDRGNFRQRILKTNILQKVGRQKEGATRRPPDLYQLDKSAYLKSLVDDVKLGF